MEHSLSTLLAAGKTAVRKLPWLVAAIVCIGLVASWIWSREPDYEGRSFAHWFDQSLSSGVNAENGAKAILAMGKAAVRPLARRSLPEGPVTKYYRANHKDLPKWMQDHLPAPRNVERDRMHSMQLLAAMGPTAHGAIPILFDVLVSNPDVAKTLRNRRNATNTNSPLGKLPPLFAMSENRFSVEAAVTITSIGWDDPALAPAIVGLFQRDLSSIDYAAASRVLSRDSLLPSARASTADLIELSRSTNKTVKGSAIFLLTRLRPIENNVRLALVDALDTSLIHTQILICQALIDENLDLDKAMPVLLQNLNTSSIQAVRRPLADLSFKTPLVITRLIEHLKVENVDTQLAATMMLAEIGPRARAALPAIESLIEDSDERLRLQSALALWRIARRAGPLIDYHLCVLRIEDDNPITNRARFLADLQPDPDSAALAMLPYLEHRDPTVRARVAMVLGGITNSAPEIRVALEQAAQDSNAEVRTAAQETLAGWKKRRK